MNSKINPAAWLPYLACVAAFYLLAAWFFKPEVLDGQALPQSDILHYLGGAQETLEYNRAHPEPTLWTTRMFSGMPTYVLQTPQPDQPIRWVDQLFKGLVFGSKSAGILFMLFFSSFVALACFGARPWVAGLAAMGFGLSTYHLILIEVGHLTKAWALAYAPLVLAGMHLAFRGRRLAGFALTALALSLELRANHVQITYYLAMIATLFGLAELVMAFQQKRLAEFAKAAGVLALAVGLGVATGAGRLLITQEYGQYSQRGKAELAPVKAANANDFNTDLGEAQANDGLSKAYAYNWSQGIGETWTLLWPYLYGGSTSEKLAPSTQTYQFLEQASQAGQLPPDQFAQLVERSPFMYRGQQPSTAGPVYAGAVLCFLFVLGLLLAPPAQRAWWLAAFTLMVFISWGKNFPFFTDLMYNYFPAYNKFRAVSMALSLGVMLMTLAGAWGLEQALGQANTPELRKKLLIAFGLTGGLSLFMALLGPAFIDFSGPQDQGLGQLAEAVLADRASLFRADAFRAFVLIGLVAGALYAHGLGKLPLWGALALTAAATLYDGWGVGRRYLNEASFQDNVLENNFTASPADHFILKDQESYRVLNLAGGDPFQDAATSYFHQSVGGYFSAKVRRYQDLLDRKLQAELQTLIGGLQKGIPNFEQVPVLNLLNTRYVIIDPQAGERGVVRNPAALGNAWWVAGVRPVQSPDEEMAALGTVPPDSLAIVDVKKFPLKTTSFNRAGATLQLTAFAPNQLTYQANNPAAGLAIFSEIYYPEGWQATIDGQPAPILRANYALRALEVPAGKHQIEFKFAPKSYAVGSQITRFSTWLVLVVVLAAIGWGFWKGE
jgi:Bacterial membrane protein YfhO